MGNARKKCSAASDKYDLWVAGHSGQRSYLASELIAAPILLLPGQLILFSKNCKSYVQGEKDYVTFNFMNWNQIQLIFCPGLQLAA